MYKKSPLSLSGRDKVAYYDNDPLQPEFFEHFVKTTYRTRHFQLYLPAIPETEPLIKLSMKPYFETYCRRRVLDELIEKNLQHSDYGREAQFLQEEFRNSHCKHFLCSSYGFDEESLIRQNRLAHYRKHLFWLLLRRNELLVSGIADGGVKYLDYFAIGDYSEKDWYGEGEVFFTFEGDKIFEIMQCRIIESKHP